jgi:hypothetical protein
MTAIRPDWGAHQPQNSGGGGAAVYAAFGDADAKVVLPDRLDIVTEANGTPAFLLTGIRPSMPTPANPPYSHLTFNLQAQSPRQPVGQASWQSAQIARGFLRFKLSAAFGVLPIELSKPFSLDWSALSATLFSLRLSPEATTLIENALSRDTLPLLALAEVEIDGISPRLPLRVHVQARKALAILRGIAAQSSGVLARASLGRHLLAQASAALAWEGADRNDPLLAEPLAEALGDQLRLRFATPVPTPFDDGTPVVALPLDDADVPDNLTWDLAAPMLAPRALALGFDPFAQARKLVAASGIGSVVKRIVTPALSSGFQRIVVTSNVPQQPAGIDMLGFRLRFPPRPPHRPHEISKTVDVARTATGFADVQLAPDEPVAWRSKCIAAVAGERGVEMIESPETAGEGSFAFAAAGSFPVRFIECTASPEILALADLLVTVTGKRRSHTFRIPLRLDKTKRRGFLAIPNDATDGAMLVEARSSTGASIALTPRGLDESAIDISHFPGYGARSITINIVFDDDSTHAAIEINPDALPDRIDVLSFTPQMPRRDTGWFCADPFHPGFRWRWRARADEAERPWSTPVHASVLSIQSSARGPSP